MKTQKIIWLLVLGVLCSSCVVLKPEIPDVEYIAEEEFVENSTLNMPITIHIESFEQLVNQQIPQTLFSKSGINVGYGVNIQLDIKRNGHIPFYTENGRIVASIPIYIKVKAEWREKILFTTVSYHKDFDAYVTVNTSTLLKIDRDWSVYAETDSDFFINKAPSLNIAGISISFASVVDDYIRSQLPQINTIIDDQIKGVLKLRHEAEKYWSKLNKPFLLTDHPVKIWGILEPDYFNFATPKSVDYKTIELNLALCAKIKSHIGDYPPDTQIGALAPVRNEENFGDNFNLNLPVVVEMETLKRLAAKELINKTFSIPDSDRKVLIQEVDVYGVGEKVVLKLYIKSQKTRGNIFLTSKLIYDPETEMVSAAQLDFDAKTNKILVNKAAWLLNKQIVSAIGEELHYDVTNDLQKAKIEAEKAINSIKLDESVFVNGQIDNISVKEIKAEANLLRINTKVTGNINVEIK